MKRLALAVIALLIAAPLSAQNQGQAQLRLVIVDETGAGIPAASITVTPANGSPVLGTSDERGLATLPDVTPGQVTVHVEFPGFLPTDQVVTLRRGANNQTVTLKIEGFQEQVLVNDAVIDDRSGNSMSTTLEQSEIEQLPDDPDELASVLQQMAGGAGAVFQVNGFRGGSLPSRDEIRQIRFRTNSFSADNHDAGRTQVEIITRPNVRNWSGNANMNFRNDAMNARNAFSQDKTPEKQNQFNLGLRGPIVVNKTSLRINVDGRRDTQADTIFAFDPNNTGVKLSQAVAKPNDSTNITVGVEHALSNNNTLRLEFRNGNSSSSNNGVGGFNLPSRATTREGDNQQFRAQVQGIVGKTSLNELRFQYIANASTTTSASSAPGIIVQDAFSTGGAGTNNHNSSKTFELADNFDFNVGRKQQMRVGFLLEGGAYNYFDQSNANGTWTFASIDDYLANRASSFKIRVGQVTTNFTTTQLGIYWQDEVKVNNRFSYSVGLRNELQSLISRKTNLMPRAGFTFTPKGNKTAIRGGYGLFYDWYDASLYDQTLRLNGTSQSDVQYLYPTYPDLAGTPLQNVQPGGRTFADPNLKLPLTHQASIGVERQITANLSAQLTYQMLRERNQMRALNDNQPVATGEVDAFGNPVFVRPDATVGNLTHIQSIGRQSSNRLTLNLNYRVPQKNIFMGGNYTFGKVQNDFDSALSLPPDSLHPEAEWGPSRQDIRHRVQGMINLPIKYGVRTNFNVNAQSAAPYNITLGTDVNRDGLLNERPTGVGRNSARGKPTYTISMRLSKQFAIGAPAGGGGNRPGGGGPRGGGPVNQQRGPAGGGGRQGGANGFNAGRYNVEMFVSADNLTNHVNYSNYSGKIYQNPLFGLPTAAQPARRVQVGMSFRF